jgi:hypothetical protein
MDTTSSVVLTAAITSVGRWAEGKSLSINVVVGGAVLAVMLAALASANEDFASKMALLILVAALFRYMVPIAKKAGWTV